MFKFIKKDGIVTLKNYSGDEEKVIVPDTYEGEPVIAIGVSAFRCCKMVEVVLPDSIEILGVAAFEFCDELKNIVLPKNLRIVKENAFSSCKSLEKVTFPIGVEKICSHCFSSCKSLKVVLAENENTVLEEHVFAGLWGYNFIEVEKISYHLIKYLELENQTKFYAKFILAWDLQENKAEILSSIKKKRNLKNNLFLSGDPTIISFLLENKIKPNLETTNEYLEHYIKEGNTVITAILLDYKKKNFKKEEIDTLNIHKELVEIGFESMTYTEFRKLWVCSRKDGKIRVSGYKGDKIEETIPAEIEGVPITVIARNKSYNYRPIETLNIKANVESISEYCFIYSNLTTVNLPDSLVYINRGAFKSCSNLESITIPASVKEICEGAFYDCSALSKVTFIGDTPTLGKYVFEFTPVEKEFC